MTPWDFMLHTTGATRDIKFANRVKSQKYAAKPESKAKRQKRDKARHARNKVEQPTLAEARRMRMRAYYAMKKATDPAWYDAMITRLRISRKSRGGK